jgi:hypothetical protein
MMGVIDDNSNHIEHKFMFANEKSKLEENNSIMFRNQNSNSFPVFQGTPKKYDVHHQQQLFEGNNEHSNISVIFPWLDSNTYNKKLFQNENSQHANNLPAKQKSPTKNIFKVISSNAEFKEAEEKKQKLDNNDGPEENINVKEIYPSSDLQNKKYGHQGINSSGDKANSGVKQCRCIICF